MFTGLVTHIGEIAAIEDFAGGRRFAVTAAFDPAGLAIGASVLHAGICLTVTDCVPDPAGALYHVEVSPETLARTNLGRWRVGARVNLERSLRAGDELGGHLVAGHADGLARLEAREASADWLVLSFATARRFAPFIAEKGSVALDGVSLTVNWASAPEDFETPDDPCRFGVTLIPHTAQATTLGALAVGDDVNLEIDLIARYLVRAAGFAPIG